MTASHAPAACDGKEKDGLPGHPKVYLEFKDGKAMCPYCGKVYAQK